jgi:hypothetical protein
MKLETKPSLLYWVISGVILLIIAAIAWVPILFIVVTRFGRENALAWSLAFVALVPLLLFRKVVSSANAARWSIDLEGLESPSIGRIALAEVASVHRGYPRPESLPMTAFQSVLAPGTREVLLDTFVLRLVDGRLLPLNLLSPTIDGGRAVMLKVQELLAAKAFPGVRYSAAEVVALRSRPLNKLVQPATR